MNTQAFTSLCKTLGELLLTERDLLLTGQAKETASLTEDKTALLEQLETWLAAQSGKSVSPDQRRQIETLVQLARENARHFETVRNGLRAAIERLETMHANAYVGSYSPDGSRLAFPDATGRYVKKG